MKEGLQKRLNNTENKSEKQLELIENKEQKQLRIKSVIDIFDDNLSQKAKNYMLNKLNNQEKSINHKRLNFKRDENLDFDLRDNKPLKELFKGIYYWKLLIDRAEDIQKEFACALTALEKYKLTKPEHIDDKLKQEDFIMEVRLSLMHLKMKYFHFSMKDVSLKMKIKMISGMKWSY